MEPHSLVGPLSPLAHPAPFWLLMALKVIGFVLHAVPMNLWYAGSVLGVALRVWGSPPARAFAERLLRRMPTIMAFGVNFGIVPLLFLQVTFYRVFYAATVLTAWFWLAIVPLVLLAYACLYVQSMGLKADRPLRHSEKVAGWTAGLAFLMVGFLFANGLSLMTNLYQWPGLWEATEQGGAVWGTASNVGDPTLWPRWLMMFGLALTTTATYVVVDAEFSREQRDEASQRWLRTLAWRLYTCGMVWFTVAGSWYVFGTWSKELLSICSKSMAAADRGHHRSWRDLVADYLPAKRLASQRVYCAAAQLAVLALNAELTGGTEQELNRFYEVAGDPVECSGALCWHSWGRC